ncbi:phosphatidylcholine and lysophosphatidylcholine phospholipase [Saitoella coloradoensis]
MESAPQAAAAEEGLLAASVLFFPRTALQVLSAVTITLPQAVYDLLSSSFTIHLSFTVLLTVIIGALGGIFYLVRYRYLTNYSRLPPASPRLKDNDSIDLPPELPDGTFSQPGINSYLDEFFSAIKIFGYLERPVFHELTRHMQTRKVSAGDTINLEDEKSFCMVVDGEVQVFVKSPASSTQRRDSDSDDESESGRDDYHLLTEAKNGAPLSSLFTILSLFTETIQLEAKEEDDELVTIIPSQGPALPRPDEADGSYFSADARDRSPAVPTDIPILNLDKKDNEHAESKAGASVHPNVVARAAVDSTIAIIPAHAFQSLTRSYPKATAHIVQVILTRFQRVTFATGHHYLGLTSEILRTERLMNEGTRWELPACLRNGRMDKLREVLAAQREEDAAAKAAKPAVDAEEPEFIVIPPLKPSSHRSSAANPTNAQAALRRRLNSRMATNLSVSRYAPPILRTTTNPGDLLSSLPRPRSSSKGSVGDVNLGEGEFLPKHAHEIDDMVDDDKALRENVLECMLKALGVGSDTVLIDNGTSLHVTKSPARSAASSVEGSPQMRPYDVRSKKVFSKAFGKLLEESTADSSTSPDDDAHSGISSTALSVHEELEEEMELVYFPKGAVLVQEGEKNPGLYYVVDGFLDVSVGVENSEYTSNGRGKGPGRSKLYMVKPGGIAGYLACVSGFRSFIDVRARSDVLVGFLPRASLERIMEKHPIVLLTMAKRLISFMSPLILQIDFALEWVQVSAGEKIYRQGDDSDAIYIVLNGRLRALAEKESGGDGEDQKRELVTAGEFGQGESVGELEVLTETPRPYTLHAIRDTELARFPKTLFHALSVHHPHITIQISRIIASTLTKRLRPEISLGGDGRSLAEKGGNTGGPSNSTNLRTITILPVTQGVPVMDFAQKLGKAMQSTGTTSCILNQAAVLGHLGGHAFTKMGKLKLSGYLADFEEKFGKVLYVADTNVNSAWTETCIRQADCILVVGVADSGPGIGEYERFLLGTKTTARKELVLVHAEQFVQPGTTRQWLKNRPWVHAHHHIQMHIRTHAPPMPLHTPRRAALTKLKSKVQVIQTEITKYTTRRNRHTQVYANPAQHKSDFARLARRLTGKAIGLVLGGGGARGCSHVGVIRAMEEAGIPIDIVGGTSIGSFVGGLYARDADSVPIYGRAKKFAGRMASLWRMLFDVTYPATAYTTGHEFNRGIWKTFGNAQIEDFWLPYYANTTNITHSRMEVHTSGYAWRYIRASMSLAGLVPPMCDEGSLLVDGGYVDNLTVSTMKKMGADIVFAVDVGSVDDTSPIEYGDTLSGFWALFNRWNPFSTVPNVPSLAEVQARLAYVASVPALEAAKQSPGCVYMRPPITPYQTLQFGKFDEICQVGYDYAVEFLQKLRKDGKLKGIVEDEPRETFGGKKPFHRRRNSL